MNYKSFKETFLNSLVDLTKASKFLKSDEVLFYQSDLQISKQLSLTADSMMERMNQVAKIATGDDDYVLFYENTHEEFAAAIDFMDDLYEQAVRKKVSLAYHDKDNLLGSTAKKSSKLLDNVNAGLDSTKSILPHHISKPQLHFKDKVNNFNFPWKPIIKCKDNAIKPLEYESDSVSNDLLTHLDGAGVGMFSALHPYQFEIQNITYPERLLTVQELEVTRYGQLEKTPLIWVDTVEKLKLLSETLRNCTEFAVDLEHHDYRSYLGFTCLIQISTRFEDYVIDALELRHELYILNVSFSDPNILKVFHGAEMDIIWLQRDFGIYVVNLFDTFHASNLLEMNKHSYAYILERYCQVKADKKYQRADWRKRPLSKELLHYARSDTHYLLYIYDVMRNDLISKSNHQSNNLLISTFERSAETCLNRFEMPLYDAVNGEGSGGWKNLLRKTPHVLNEENLAVFRAIHSWRDHIARKEDESTGYVLPNHQLFKLSRFMPISSKDLIAGCVPTPPLVRLYAKELASIIEETIASVQQSTKEIALMIDSQIELQQKQNIEFVINEKEITNDDPSNQSTSTLQLKHSVPINIISESSTFGPINIISESSTFGTIFK